MLKKIIRSFLFILLSTHFLVAHAAATDELLKPDVAFKASISSDSPEKIQVSWDIADGYYMYRKRFSFKSDTPGITLGTPVFPKGKVKADPGFGSVVVYRHKMTADIPVIRDDPSATLVSIKTKSQGCADIGVCYPPQKKKLSIQLASARSSAVAEKKAPATSSTGGFSLAKQLGITGLGDANAPLKPDEAFAYDISATDKQNLNARWDITKGHYLYKNKIKFSLVNPPEGVSLGTPSLPKGKKENDKYFGDIVIYTKDFDAKLPLSGTADNVTVRATYQGCSKLTGICYPPQTKTQTINLSSAADAPANSSSAGSNSSLAVADTATSATPIATKADTDDTITLNKSQSISTGNSFLDKSLNSKSLLSIFIAALGAGLLLAFTACMYPMIPILSSIIVGQGKEVSTLKGLGLSLVYVLSLAVTFGIVGAITASVAGGIGIQAYFQNTYVLIAFSLLFVVLAFSMFGFYDIQVPSFIQNKLSNLSNNQKGGSLIGVAIMGSLSALIVGPCGGPVLAAMLGYAAASSSMTSGFIALFALGLGMGLPLLIVGAGGGKLLPKAGDWMTAVKATAGVILLAVSLLILERMPHIFPTTFTMLLWALLFIISGVYLGAFSSLKEGTSGWMKLWKGFGVAAVLYGAMVLFGGQMGGQTVTDPLYGIKSGSIGVSQGGVSQSNTGGGATLRHVTFKRIKTTDDLKREILLAKQQGKAVMLDFYADWCLYCKGYERYVFPDPSVRKYLDNMVLLQSDVTAMDKIDESLMKVLGISLPPAILFFDKNGKEIPSSRILGDMKTKEFADHLEKYIGS